MSGISPSMTMMDINNNQPQTVREVFKGMGRLSYSYAKNFAVVGSIFAGSECVIESVRGSLFWHFSYFIFGLAQ